MTRSWGRQQDWQYLYLKAKDGEKCKVCGKNGCELVIDHIDNDPRNRNPENLRLACRSCNRKNTSKVMSESERINLPSATAQLSGREWSSKEGQKHDIMRGRWDKWVESLGRFRLRESNMVAKARSACGGIGSSVTYRRYLEEDIAGGLLDRYEDTGIYWIEPMPKKEMEPRKEEVISHA